MRSCNLAGDICPGTVSASILGRCRNDLDGKEGIRATEAFVRSHSGATVNGQGAAYSSSMRVVVATVCLITCIGLSEGDDAHDAVDRCRL